jgi:hypothetical protein
MASVPCDGAGGGEESSAFNIPQIPAANAIGASMAAVFFIKASQRVKEIV